MKTTLLSAAVVAAAATAASPAFAGAVLDKIRANDQLVCGVNTSAPGFPVPTVRGIGRVSTSIFADPWLQRCLAMQTR